jgi:hypothetical protein
VISTTWRDPLVAGGLDAGGLIAVAIAVGCGAVLVVMTVRDRGRGRATGPAPDRADPLADPS